MKLLGRYLLLLSLLFGVPARANSTAAARLSAENLSSGGLPQEVYAFKQDVYRRHVARGEAGGNTRVFDLPPSQLARVPGTSYRMKPDAARALGRLLHAARLDLRRDSQSRNNAYEARYQRWLAGRVASIGINNTYRSASRQFDLWDGYFLDYYRAVRPQLYRMPGGVHGEAAAERMREYVGERIAAPGYSNHQRGIAVDFRLGMKGLNQKWSEYWFWHWLNRRASEFGFVPYAPEAWHWEYKPEEVDKQTTTFGLEAK